jgi:hypothetical protein
MLDDQVECTPRMRLDQLDFQERESLGVLDVIAILHFVQAGARRLARAVAKTPRS